MKQNDMIEVTEHNVNIGTAWNWDLINWSPLQFYFVKNKDVRRK